MIAADSFKKDFLTRNQCRLFQMFSVFELKDVSKSSYGDIQQWRFSSYILFPPFSPFPGSPA